MFTEPPWLVLRWAAGCKDGSEVILLWEMAGPSRWDQNTQKGLGCCKGERIALRQFNRLAPRKGSLQILWLIIFVCFW
jgi:hypothetical protein